MKRSTIIINKGKHNVVSHNVTTDVLMQEIIKALACDSVNSIIIYKDSDKIVTPDTPDIARGA